MYYTRHIVNGIIRLNKNGKMKIQIDKTDMAFKNLKKELEIDKPVKFSATIEINSSNYTWEDILSHKLSLKN
jgi:site-specific DNA-adenine methylase